MRNKQLKKYLDGLITLTAKSELINVACTGKNLIKKMNRKPSFSASD
jgi:hypothetical protein